MSVNFKLALTSSIDVVCDCCHGSDSPQIAALLAPYEERIAVLIAIVLKLPRSFRIRSSAG